MLASLTEETEGINWCEQRIPVEKDPVAKAIMENGQHEEFKHFGMDPEFLLRKKEKRRATLKEILFNEGDRVKLGEKGEEKGKGGREWPSFSCPQQSSICTAYGGNTGKPKGNR
jgi:hypothetical protein